MQNNGHVIGEIRHIDGEYSEITFENRYKFKMKGEKYSIGTIRMHTKDISPYEFQGRIIIPLDEMPHLIAKCYQHQNERRMSKIVADELSRDDKDNN